MSLAHTKKPRLGMHIYKKKCGMGELNLNSLHGEKNFGHFTLHRLTPVAAFAGSTLPQDHHLWQQTIITSLPIYLYLAMCPHSCLGFMVGWWGIVTWRSPVQLSWWWRPWWRVGLSILV